MLRSDPRNQEVVLPFLIGHDLVTGSGQPTRYVIDFQGRDILTAQTYEMPFKYLEKTVLPDRQRKAEEGKTASGKLRPHHQLFLRYWWRQAYDRAEMISTINTIPRYIVCSAHTKRKRKEKVSVKKVSVNGIAIFLLEAQDAAWLASYEWNIRARFITL